MSYTMKLDVPPKTAEYVERRGPRYRAELNAIFIAIVTANMQNDADEARHDVATEPLVKTGATFARAWGRIGLGEGELDLSRRPEHMRDICFG